MPGIALVSVSDKTALDDLGRALERLGWTVISTGGTAKVLRDAGCKVTEVADHTGFPQMLDGRVKTLHPKVFGGILAAPTDDHRAQIARQNIPEIDLVVVNLYPFKQTVAKPDVTPEMARTNIDIGVLLAASTLLFVWMFTGKRRTLDRWEAAIFLAGYAVYVVAIVVWLR